MTERIGLVGTVSSTYLPPYHLARKVATPDHLERWAGGLEPGHLGFRP